MSVILMGFGGGGGLSPDLIGDGGDGGPAIFDMQSIMADQVFIFPHWTFGTPPPAGGGLPGQGGPIIEQIHLCGTTGGTSQSLGGNVDDTEEGSCQ